MAKSPRRTDSPSLKAKGALVAVKGDRSLSELSQQFKVHPNQTTQWKTQLLSQAAEAFDNGQDETVQETHHHYSYSDYCPNLPMFLVFQTNTPRPAKTPDNCGE